MFRSVFLSLVALMLAVTVILPIGTQAASPTATLRISPTSGTVSVGGTLAVDVLLDTGGQGVSYVVGDISFSDNLEFVSANTANSVMPTPVNAPAANGQTVRFELTRTHDEGYKGSGGLVVKLTFKPKSEGQASLTINQGNSQVLAFEDSSNILKSVGGGTYTVKAGSATAASSSGSKASPKATPVSVATSPSAEASPVAAPVVTPSPEVSLSPSPSAPSTILVRDANELGETSTLAILGELAVNLLAIFGGLILVILAVFGRRIFRREVMQYIFRGSAGGVSTATTPAATPQPPLPPTRQF